ncbi:hypothetical protein [Nitrospira sp. Kam-Ns4a]
MAFLIADTRGDSLARRVRRLWDILDGLMLDQGEVRADVEKAVVLDQMEQGRIPEVVRALVSASRRNPLWLPGYLLAAEIYQEAEATDQAVETLQAGLRVCRTVLRLLMAQLCEAALGGPEHRIIQHRLSVRAAHMRRYEAMLRRQVAAILIKAERFDEALGWLSDGGSG